MKRAMSSVVLVLWFLLGFAGVAAASAAVAPESEPSVASAAGDVTLDAAQAVYQAFRDGNPALGAVLLLILAVAAARKYGPASWRTDLGGALLVAVMSGLGVLAAAAGSGGWAAMASLSVVWKALAMAASAAGGYSMVKRAGRWLLGRWGDRLPAWLRGALNAALWIFDAKPGEDAIKEAEAAGDAAVAAKPPVGFGPTNRLP